MCAATIRFLFIYETVTSVHLTSRLPWMNGSACMTIFTAAVQFLHDEQLSHCPPPKKRKPLISIVSASAWWKLRTDMEWWHAIVALFCSDGRTIFFFFTSQPVLNPTLHGHRAVCSIQIGLYCSTNRQFGSADVKHTSQGGLSFKSVLEN